MVIYRYRYNVCAFDPLMYAVVGLETSSRLGTPAGGRCTSFQPYHLRVRLTLDERSGLRCVVSVRGVGRRDTTVATVTDAVAAGADLEHSARRHTSYGLAVEWVA